MSTRSILVLDFDGVVCDSTEECVVTAWNAWQIFSSGARRTPSLVRDAGEVPEPYRGTLRAHRNYVRTAGEYLILIEAALKNGEIASQAEYDRLFESSRPRLGGFAGLFFDCRQKLRQEDERRWLDLHRIYTGMPGSLRALWAAFECYVVTGKDRESVLMLFERFALPIEAARVFDKDAAHDKLHAIRMISAQLSQPLSAALFVDDNVHHLLPAHEAGCRVFLAGWGYHTEEQLQTAKKASIPILQPGDWAGTLLGQRVTA